VELRNADFIQASLKITSFARPGKLFTAHGNLVQAEIGQLNNHVLEQIKESVVKILRGK
jgi:mRNA interferase MazF